MWKVTIAFTALDSSRFWNRCVLLSGPKLYRHVFYCSNVNIISITYIIICFRGRSEKLLQHMLFLIFWGEGYTERQINKMPFLKFPLKFCSLMWNCFHTDKLHPSTAFELTRVNALCILSFSAEIIKIAPLLTSAAYRFYQCSVI